MTQPELDRDAQATPRTLSVIENWGIFTPTREDVTELSRLSAQLERELIAATAREEEAEKRMAESKHLSAQWIKELREEFAARLAALEAALKEPTKSMLVAGEEAVHDGIDWTQDSYESYQVYNEMDLAMRAYKAMIAVALSALPDAGKESGGHR